MGMGVWLSNVVHQGLKIVSINYLFSLEFTHSYIVALKHSLTDTLEFDSQGFKCSSYEDFSPIQSVSLIGRKRTFTHTKGNMKGHQVP